MKLSTVLLFIPLLLTLSNCRSQPPKSDPYFAKDYSDEIPFYRGMPDALSDVDTSPAWTEDGQQIILTGTVFQADGKTVAPDVILYYYQTGTDGTYTHRAEVTRSLPPNDLGQTHGYIRGWVKTNQAGRYTIKTILPGIYPSRAEVAHIHVYVKEPDLANPYYIDSFVFDDDPLLTSQKRAQLEARGGSGIIRFVQEGDKRVGERNILLGLNLPDYPKAVPGRSDGIKLGEEIMSFTPTHAWGPDSGTRTCPICKYGWYNGILYYVGNHPDWNEIEQWLRFLEEESVRRKGFLKVYFIYGNEHNYSVKQRQEQLADLGQRLQLTQLALTYVPSLKDKESGVYHTAIDPNYKHSFLLYKRSRVHAKMINLAPTTDNFLLIQQHLDAAENDYFKLPRSTWKVKK